jgi:hypothetical protein
MNVGGQKFSDSELKALERIVGPHTFRIVMEQPTFHGNPILDPALIPLATNRRPPSRQAVSAGVAANQPGAGAGQAANAPGQKLDPLALIKKQALDNMRQVAEAQGRLAASGLVSIDTFDQQRKAMEFLNTTGKQKEEQDKKLSKGAVAIRDAFQGVQKSMLITSATMAATIAELHHLAGAASPGLLRAWDGALGVLQAKIGHALLPAIEWTIDAIQSIADWFDSLSDTGKKLAASAVVAVPALVGLTHAGMALVPALQLAQLQLLRKVRAEHAEAAAASEAATAIEAASLRVQAAAAGSAGIGAAGIAGRAGVAAFTVGLIRELQINRAGGGVGERLFGTEAPDAGTGVPSTREMHHASGVLRSTGVESDDARLRFPNMVSPAVRARWLRQLEEKQARGENWFFNSSVGVARVGTEEIAQAAQTLRRFETHGRSESVDEKSWRQGVRHLRATAATVQQEQQPRYSGLADVRKQLQLQVLSQDPFKQQQLKEQRETRAALVKRLDELLRQGRDKGYRLME